LFAKNNFEPELIIDFPSAKKFCSSINSSFEMKFTEGKIKISKSSSMPDSRSSS